MGRKFQAKFLMIPVVSFGIGCGIDVPVSCEMRANEYVIHMSDGKYALCARMVHAMDEI